jgi:hypothetical protein
MLVLFISSYTRKASYKIFDVETPQYVLLKYGRGARVIVEALKLLVSLSLILSFVPDIEAMA